MIIIYKVYSYQHIPFSYQKIDNLSGRKSKSNPWKSKTNNLHNTGSRKDGSTVHIPQKTKKKVFFQCPLPLFHPQPSFHFPLCFEYRGQSIIFKKWTGCRGHTVNILHSGYKLTARADTAKNNTNENQRKIKTCFAVLKLVENKRCFS